MKPDWSFINGIIASGFIGFVIGWLFGYTDGRRHPRDKHEG